MTTSVDVLIVGSGNAALVAGLAAQDEGCSVLIVEKGDESLAGGNTRYTAGAMRFAYDGAQDLLPLLSDPDDPRLANADFGAYPESAFAADLAGFNDGVPLTPEQQTLVAESLPTVRWLAELGLRFDPIWERQAFEQDGRRIFWGGLTLEAAGEGDGLFHAERDLFLQRGGVIDYGTEMVELLTSEPPDPTELDGSVGGRVEGIVTATGQQLRAGAVVLACGGFEANAEQRVAHLGEVWESARVRGTPLNTGAGLEVAYSVGAVAHGVYQNCHATPMDRHMVEYGNLELPPTERKNYRKICYFLGVMINAEGRRFVDEGRNFRNYTYAQFGRAILEQPGSFAWQLFDAKVDDLLYEEYRFHDAHFVESGTLEGLIDQLADVDRTQAAATIAQFNEAVDDSQPFNPTALDGRQAVGIDPPRSNWAQRLDTPPFRAYPVTGGITFTYGGLKVDANGAVLRSDGSPIAGLHACGELVGGVFIAGYPGGSGLTSGAVFGRRAGIGAANGLGQHR